MDTPRLPQNETVYKVAMLTGAFNEPFDHWETVGEPYHLRTDAEESRDSWARQFPDREWIVLKAVTAWEHIA